MPISIPSTLDGSKVNLQFDISHMPLKVLMACALTLGISMAFAIPALAAGPTDQAARIKYCPPLCAITWNSSR